MDVQSVLLGFLMHKSMTGYDINKAFSISFSFFSGLSYGSIYPALNKMRRQGLITMEIEIAAQASFFGKLHLLPWQIAFVAR